MSWISPFSCGLRGASWKLGMMLGAPPGTMFSVPRGRLTFSERIASTSGLRKYSATSVSSCTGISDNSHMTRKKAIIAVIKLSYAFFQLPPCGCWCCGFVGPTTARGSVSFMSQSTAARARARLFHLIFQRHGGGTQVGIQDLAAELDGKVRRVA